VDDHCEECGFDARNLSTDEVSARLGRVPGDVQSALAVRDPALLRQRPDPETWSPIEYLGHLRDLMAWHRFLIEQGIAEDRPAVPVVDPDASVADSGYADADVDQLFGQFTRRVDRLRARIDALEPGQAARKIQWVQGQEIDVQLVARSALHEGFHHTADLHRLLDGRPGGLD
jgi:hypothetical protein